MMGGDELPPGMVRSYLKDQGVAANAVEKGVGDKFERYSPEDVKHEFLENQGGGDEKDLQQELPNNEYQDRIEDYVDFEKGGTEKSKPFYKTKRFFGLLTVLTVLGLSFGLGFFLNGGGRSSSKSGAKPSSAAIQTLCENLAPLEEHMKSSFHKEFGENVDVINKDYTCLCSNANDTSVQVDCEMIYEYERADGFGALVPTNATNFESANIRDVNGELVLESTAWGDTSMSDISTVGQFFETYSYNDNGKLVGCKVKNCNSCSLCTDGVSMEIDCPSLPSFNDGDYNVQRSELYKGTFFNTFFSPSLPSNDAVNAFCSDLNILETYMNNSYSSDMTHHQCACNPINETMLQLDCAGSNPSGSETAFEQALLRIDGDQLTPVRTGWGNSDFNNAGGNFQELFDFSQDGTSLVGCRHSDGCSSCSVCPGGLTVAFDCDPDYVDSCADKWQGAVFNKYFLLPALCSNLTDIEEHLTTSYESIFGSTDSNYKCACSRPEREFLQLDCSMDYFSGINFENATFHIDLHDALRSAPALFSSGWGDTVFQPIDTFQESFSYSSSGTLASCSGNGCSDCLICPDGFSHTIDCTALPGNLSYQTSACGFRKSFLNSYFLM